MLHRFLVFFLLASATMHASHIVVYGGRIAIDGVRWIWLGREIAQAAR